MSARDFEESPLAGDAGLLRTRVFTQIEEDIINGKYKPGESLTEMRLSEEMKVSRTPIREALRKLELEGLVQSIPNKGVIVVGIDWKDIEDIYKIKVRIEGLAARLAAEKITEEELKELGDVLDLTGYYLSKNDVANLLKLDGQFHQIIFQASKSRPLMYLLGTLHNYVKRARNESLTVPGRAEKMLQEHRNIFEAIQKGDAQQAEKAYVKHIRATLGNLKKTPALQESS